MRETPSFLAHGVNRVPCPDACLVSDKCEEKQTRKDGKKEAEIEEEEKICLRTTIRSPTVPPLLRPRLKTHLPSLPCLVSRDGQATGSSCCRVLRPDSKEHPIGNVHKHFAAASPSPRLDSPFWPRTPPVAFFTFFFFFFFFFLLRVHRKIRWAEIQTGRSVRRIIPPGGE